MGANGPLIWVSAKPIHGNPVNNTPRRYSASTQLEAKSSPDREEDLKSRIDKQAIEKYKATYVDSKKTAM
jgi:hypothetical protein